MDTVMSLIDRKVDWNINCIEVKSTRKRRALSHTESRDVHHKIKHTFLTSRVFFVRLEWVHAVLIYACLRYERGLFSWLKAPSKYTHKYNTIRKSILAALLVSTVIREPRARLQIIHHALVILWQVDYCETRFTLTAHPLVKKRRRDELLALSPKRWKIGECVENNKEY